MKYERNPVVIRKELTGGRAVTGGAFTQGKSGGPVVIRFAPGAGPKKPAVGP